ncbi:hypothetical protein BU24DRAFT_418112 [Aaosphaeria arxii CBS 175.79]|uniref:C2H2-type domain-containing protein n=1 Tax=Aaosphaeria arxii CBS 175.79 TaxID=1450172 RepID=A0A6A5Y1A2_9PLEO|nr:uncharacterized protein BU24DRAFT_418112 [Aaosphaeria arxii CBS 175.79]KAF2018590.1 hypothetical protein BU24DRAFT_418112 [Aaosphaeria arxii CBS 175.79]
MADMNNQQPLEWQDLFWTDPEIDLDALTFLDNPLPSPIDPALDLDLYGISGNNSSVSLNYSTPGAASVEQLVSAPSSQPQSPEPSLPLHSALAERPSQLHQQSLIRRRSKYFIRRTGSQQSAPIVIHSGNSGRTASPSLPMQRWRDSPPENEASSLSAIYNAVQNSNGSATSLTDRPISAEGARPFRRPASIASCESVGSESSIQSITSSRSATSGNSRSAQALKGRRRPKSTRKKDMNTADRIFKCTFCCDTFKHKYDWSRHEKSLHLSMEEWVCSPQGGCVVLAHTGRVHCAYCSALDPNTDHLKSHNHEACQSNASTPRTFRRKDHLVQHLRLFHRLETMPLIEDWKVEILPVVSRCGFCDAALNSWDERTDHLAAHFREGKTMIDWKGDHGFSPAVAARVCNNLPPYVLGLESLSPVPFSATNPDSVDHFKQMALNVESSAPGSTTMSQEQKTPGMPPSLATLSNPVDQSPLVQPDAGLCYVDLLSRHLASFAREQIANGIIPTDEMFQNESRRVTYQDGTDTWNTTLADNPHWLNKFRHSNGWSE